MVELWGLEPQTSSLPARRSSQLSYSPTVDCEKNGCAGTRLGWLERQGASLIFAASCPN